MLTKIRPVLYRALILIKTALPKWLDLSDENDNNTEKLLEQTGFIKRFLQLNRLNLLMVLLATIAIRIPSFLQTIQINNAGDFIGSFFIAARIAGLDWSGVSATTSYYGQGYYALLSPVFMLTDDPYLIWLLLLLVNSILVTLFSIIIYSISVIFCKLPDKLPTVFIAAYCASTIYAESNVRNEVPIFFVIWLTTLLMFISMNSRKKIKVLATLGLLIVLFWGMFIHTRLELIVIIISIGAFLYFCCFRVWIISPLLFYPGISIVFLIANKANNYLSSIIYDNREFSQITNATLIPDRVFNKIPSLKSLIDVVISNLCNISLSTYGLATISLIIFIIIIYEVITRILLIRKRNDEGFSLPRDQLVVMFLFMGCIIISVIGIYLRWGHQVDAFYLDSGGDKSRWFNNGRYYTSYYSPVILTTTAYIMNNSKKIFKVIISSFIMFNCIYIYTYTFIKPIIENANDYINGRDYFVTFIGYKTNFIGSVIIIAFFFVLFYLLTSMRKTLFLVVPQYLVIIITFLFGLVINPLSLSFFRVTASSSSLDSLHAELMHINSFQELPEEIYVYGTQRYALELQFLFNHYKIKRGLPESSDEIGLLIGSISDENSVLLRKYGYTNYLFPDNANIWIKGDDIKNGIKSYASEYNTKYLSIDPILEELILNDDFKYVFYNGIDDIWVYQGVLSDRHFVKLSSINNIDIINEKYILIDGIYSLDNYLNVVQYGSYSVVTVNE